MKFIIVAVTAFALCTAVGTAAEEKKGGDKPKPNFEEMFKKMDKDADGAVSLEEYKAVAGKKDPVKAEETFKKKDKNSDGKLTIDEFKPQPGKGKGKKKGQQ